MKPYRLFKRFAILKKVIDLYKYWNEKVVLRDGNSSFQTIMHTVVSYFSISLF